MTTPLTQKDSRKEDAATQQIASKLGLELWQQRNKLSAIEFRKRILSGRLNRT